MRNRILILFMMIGFLGFSFNSHCGSDFQNNTNEASSVVSAQDMAKVSLSAPHDCGDRSRPQESNSVVHCHFGHCGVALATGNFTLSKIQFASVFTYRLLATSNYIANLLRPPIS